MAQFGKSAAKRGKPSYFMSILGVTLVLFLLGIIGWLGINSKKLMQHFKESVEVHIFLKNNIQEKDRLVILDSIKAKPFTREVRYTSQQDAINQWRTSEGISEFMDTTLIPSSIDFTLKEQYVDSAQLAAIKEEFSAYRGVDEIRYPVGVVGTMQRNFRAVSIVLIVIAVIVAILVIILIDNTIRLAMFSNRFLIKTMQMVGATRWFIAKPLDIRAVINGAVSAFIASAAIYFSVLLAENFFPGFTALWDNQLFIFLFLVLLLIGVSITLISTHRSVVKYLRMKLDELY